ncbi:MAG: hypothetical protein QOE68_3056, partial [Thermoanaerobaculia bacterium]|nr:hypothetical protein [Thermoanaerobaculia bacterium]
IPEQVQPAAAIEPVVTAGVTTTTEGGGGTGEALGVPDGVAGGIGTEGAGSGDVAPMRPIGEVKAPVIVRRVLPDYPSVAVRGRINGWVIVECIIDKTGHIRDARVLKSSFAAFEQPALDAVQQWVFSPGSLHGQPVDTIFDLTVTFQVR